LIIAVISFFAAWVATSSERLSYAGLQIAIAFFFSVLVGYGPTIDLTEARDRVAGILLGNIIVFVVFTAIWPISAVVQGRRFLADALNKLSQLLVTATDFRKDTLFLAESDALSQASRLISLNLFEPKGIQDEKIATDHALIDAVQALNGPVIILKEQNRLNPEQIAYNKSLSGWLSSIAEQLISRKGLIAPPPDIEHVATESSVNEWYRTLHQRVYQLDMLLKKSITYIQMNLAIKGSA